MQRFQITASLREQRGSGASRQLRRNKQTPAVLYGSNIAPLALTIRESDIRHIVNHGSANALVDLKVGEQSHTAMIKEIQFHQIKDEVVHVDFHTVDLAKKISATVPVHIQGEAEGVKAGGVLQYQTREVEVKCLPTDIPEYLSLDISDLEFGQAKTVADLHLPANVELLTPENEVIVSVLAPRLTEEPADAEGEVAEAEAEDQQPVEE